MSRIGKKPIAVPGNVNVAINASARSIQVEGPKGKLSYDWRPEVAVDFNEGEKTITCTISEAQMQTRKIRAHWGTTRARIQNLMTGVTEGYTKKLEIVGVGWNAKDKGKQLQLNIGFCHPVNMTPVAGVEFAVENNFITITGPDKQAVGQFAAEVRAKRPPEPYKGKGIKYIDEYIIRKQGKVFGA